MDKFFEYTVTGYFPTIVLSGVDGVKSLTASHKVTARNKGEAAKIFKQAGLLEIAKDKFVNSSTAVLIVVLTEDELKKQNKDNEKES